MCNGELSQKNLRLLLDRMNFLGNNLIIRNQQFSCIPKYGKDFSKITGAFVAVNAN